MIESSLPRWSARLDAQRKHGFGDLLPVLASHLRVHEAAEAFLGPYNARQRSSSMPYRVPDAEVLRKAIPQGGMNDVSYRAFIQSLIRFCETTKGMRGLPTPHPSLIHSIQLPSPAFMLQAEGRDALSVYLPGVAEPLLVKSLTNPADIKFIIVRPKLSKLGTASINNWEVLFFRQAVGYIPEWVDSNLNPRYSGKLN